MKRGVDPVSAWILAVLSVSAVYGGVYFVSKVVAKRIDAANSTGDEGAHGEERPGASHGGDAHSGDAHSGDAHGSESGGHDDPHGETKDAHETQTTSHGGEAPAHGEQTGHEETPAHAEKAEHDDKTGHGDNAGHGEKKNKASVKEAAWEYKGSSGPDRWSDLSPDYKSCETGKRQSPVDIDETVTDRKLLPIKFYYKEDDALLKNNGHTILAEFPQGNYIEVEGERYDLMHLEFHAPSEHKVSGIPYDMEVQLVHKSVEGKFAIVSALFEEGATSKSFEPIWKVMPQEIGDTPEPIQFNPATLLPTKRIYYYYQGSLTAPPCTEGVKWLVMVHPETVAAKQVDKFAAIVSFNARPVQPLKGRKVAKSLR